MPLVVVPSRRSRSERPTRCHPVRGADTRHTRRERPGAAAPSTDRAFIQPPSELLVGGGIVDFARIFDAAPDPCLVLTPEFVIRGANQAYLRATGRTLDGLVGRFMFDAFPDNPADPAADGVANLRASFERAIATGRADAMALQKYDIEVCLGDAVRFEERYWSPINVPVLDDDGRVELLIHRVLDVTELVRDGHGARAGGREEEPRDAVVEPARPAACPQAGRRAAERPTEGEIAAALQAALLPHAVRVVGPLEVATRYLPARAGLEVCGDWYDVAALDETLMGLVVGDVVGHGLEAAAVMGQLRGAATAALHVAASPGAAMRVLERRARSIEGAQSATTFIAVIDPATGTLTYSNAGQVPPLLVRADGTIIELDGARAPVLCAVDHDAPHPEATVEFGPGSLLVAFTDGLVERAGEELSRGYERLRRAVAAGAADLERYADAVLAVALEGHVRTDDLAMVVIGHRR